MPDAQEQQGPQSVDRKTRERRFEADGIGQEFLARVPDVPPTGGAGGRVHVEFGVVIAPGWSSGNSLTVHPCDENGANAGPAVVTVYAVTPTGKAVTYVEAEEGDVVAYLPYGGDKGVLVNVIHGATCGSPKAIYATFEGSETAQCDNWARDDQAPNDGVTIPVTTRVVYNEAGDEKLYGFYRTLTFDSAGQLKNISAETRYEIDVPGPCVVT